MIINLSGLFKDYGDAVSISEKINLKNTDFLGEEFEFPSGLMIDGKITNNTKSLHFTAKVTGSMTVHCARCCKPVEQPVDFEISEILVKEDQVTSDDDDVVVFSGHEIDIDDIVINNFLMNVSAKFLCKEDCKGLCPQCGRDLNTGDCDCSDEEIDPRWAALAEIMKNSDTE